jgi:acyl-CoA-binding protein
MDGIVIGTARADAVWARIRVPVRRSAIAGVWNKPSATPRHAIVMIVGHPITAPERIKMTNLDTQFTQAQEDVKQLPERPGNLTLLRLYALFKQASEGDVQGDKPGFTDIVGKYKYDAWAALKGTAQDAAKQQYVELVESLKSGASA